MKWTVSRIVLFLVSAITLSACGDQLPDYRYKMTVYVSASGQVLRYSTVREVQVGDALSISAPNAPGLSRKLRGEAVIMALPDGTTVFTLLEQNIAKFPEDYAVLRGRSVRNARQDLQARLSVKGEHDLSKTLDFGDGRSANLWPRMVRFTAIDEPRSVVAVDPDALPGGGRVQRITIEMTDAPVSANIRRHLGWLDRYRNLSFLGNRYSRDDSLQDTLRAGSFTTETAE